MQKILIIDDNEESRTLLKHVFSDTHPLVLVDSLTAANDVYQTSPETFGLIFLDIDVLTSDTTGAPADTRPSLFEGKPAFLITHHHSPDPDLASFPIAITGQFKRPLDIKHIRGTADQFLK